MQARPKDARRNKHKTHRIQQPRTSAFTQRRRDIHQRTIPQKRANPNRRQHRQPLQRNARRNRPNHTTRHIQRTKPQTTIGHPSTSVHRTKTSTTRQDSHQPSKTVQRRILDNRLFQRRRQIPSQDKTPTLRICPDSNNSTSHPMRDRIRIPNHLRRHTKSRTRHNRILPPELQSQANRQVLPTTLQDNSRSAKHTRQRIQLVRRLNAKHWSKRTELRTNQ